MPNLTPLDLKFTAEARVRIFAFLSSIKSYTPTLCLMKGFRTPEDDGTLRDRIEKMRDLEECWTIGAYGPENIEHVAPELERLGKPLLYSADGFVVAIPQFDLVSELVGKLADYRDNRLVLNDRESHIGI